MYVPGQGLECYVCDKQKGNDEKCMKTIKVCEHGDDMCLTDIRWGSKYLQPHLAVQG